MKTFYNITRKISALLILFSLSIFNSNAQKSNDLVTKEYPISAFNKFKVGSDFNVYLIKGDVANLKLEAEEEFHANFKAEVKDNQLVITHTKKMGKNKVYVTYTNLIEIDGSGACNIKGDSIAIKADKFYLEMSGASNVKLVLDVNELTTKLSGASDAKLSGKALVHNTKISGAADLKAYNLATETTTADVSGAGTARINSKNKITGEVSGAGNIYYAEEPTEKSITTSGAGSYKKSNKVNDSTKVRIGNKKIVVVDDETGENLAEVDYDDDDMENNKSKKVKYNGIWSGFEMGFNGYMDNKFSTKMSDEYKYLEFKPGKSLAYSLNILELNKNITKKHFGITTGLGFTWNNYRFDNTTVLENDSAKIFGYKDITNSYSKSKLRTTFITVPLLLGYQTGGKKGKSFKVNVGVIASYKIDSYAKRITNTDKKIKEREEFHLNPFKCDATVRVGWRYFKVYANYSLTEMFKKDEGPKVYPFNVGVVLLSL